MQAFADDFRAAGIVKGRASKMPLLPVFVDRIVSLVVNATNTQWAAGYSWYATLCTWCDAMGVKYGLDTWQVAGIVAALSPMLKVSRNLLLAEEAIKACTRGQLPTGTFTPNCVKAQRIYHGECPTVVLGDYKTLHFFWSIITSGDTDMHAAIDMWCMLILSGGRVKKVDDSWYEYCASAFIESARQIRRMMGSSVTTAQVQAIAWVAYRGSAW